MLGALLLLLAVQSASVSNLQSNGIQFDVFSQKDVDKKAMNFREVSSLLQTTHTEKAINRKKTDIT